MPKTYILPEKNRLQMQKVWGKALFGSENEIKRKYAQTLAWKNTKP